MTTDQLSQLDAFLCPIIRIIECDGQYILLCIKRGSLLSERTSYPSATTSYPKEHRLDLLVNVLPGFGLGGRC